ncbi:steroid delta-isomerase domain protein [Obelidium mucronatum]|nr:steroid delta-isomerase domain protein [Obelidium mucronatum]
MSGSASASERLAQKQLDAYNSRDIDAFVACYSPTVQVFSFPSMILRFPAGIDELKSRYGLMFAQYPELHAKLVKRMVHGDKCVDEEYVTGRGDQAIKAVAVYWVKDNLIETVWFLEEKTESE